MKKYFIDTNITYCYPYNISHKTTDYGVLSRYVGKCFNRDKIDEIICELITRHPYVENSMRLNISVKWKENNTIGFYHNLCFENDNYKKQNKGCLEIKYEK